MRELDNYEVWLLISGEELYPFSSHGFEFAQGSLRSVVARSSDNLFLNAEGEVFKIAGIYPHHNNLAAKTMRLLNIPYGIEVKLERQNIEISELKEMLVVGLENYRSQADDDEVWTFATLPPSTSKTSIMNANDTVQLFAILDLPTPLDCLDSL
ncbi:hypothetical protein [Litoreibacter roseus]|uniref:hypothetical protein n=1 Tax=Litoreibacter roseus TaxID=2601869 RepID=UPI001358CB33|nr:hypothetical protein [Litoreibacter roseus]